MNEKLELLKAAAITLESANRHLALGNLHESGVLLQAATLLVADVTRMAKAD